MYIILAYMTNKIISGTEIMVKNINYQLLIINNHY